MNNVIGVIVVALVGLLLLLGVFKGVGFIFDHPVWSLLIAGAVAAFGSYFTSKKK